MAYVLDDKLPAVKPCPFCGREPALQKDKRYPKMTNGSALPVDAYSVICNTYSCPIYRADNTWFTTAETAIEKWNERNYKIVPYIDVDTAKCPECKVQLTRQELLGDDVLFEDFFEYCPRCGKKVDWDVLFKSKGSNKT